MDRIKNVRAVIIKRDGHTLLWYRLELSYRTVRAFAMYQHVGIAVKRHLSNHRLPHVVAVDQCPHWMIKPVVDHWSLKLASRYV